MERPENETIIEKVKEGNKEAFSVLFRMHYPRIFSFLNKLLKDKELAEEITQDVFFRLWLNREHLDPTQSVDSYMYRIAKNTVINLSKKKEIERKYQDIQVHEERESTTEQQIHYDELQRLIDLAVENMPPQQKLIFRLSREQGLQNAEIAEQLQISKRTVEKHISNSLQVLRKVIEKNYLLFFI